MAREQIGEPARAAGEVDQARLGVDPGEHPAQDRGLAPVGPAARPAAAVLAGVTGGAAFGEVAIHRARRLGGISACHVLTRVAATPEWQPDMGTTIDAAPGADAMIRALGLDHPGAWGTFAAGEKVNATGRGFVRRFRWPTADGPHYYFKLYRLSRPWKVIRSAFRKDPARRERDNLAWLRAHGFPAVEPVAWGCRRVARIVRECFIVTRAETGLETLRALVAEARVSATPRTALREAAKALGGVVRNLHDAGFFARDLYFRNILCPREAVLGKGGDHPSFTFLDFPNGSLLPPGDSRREAAAVWDLVSLYADSRLHASRTDRLRFLLAYQRSRIVDRDLVRLIELHYAHRAKRRERALRDRARRKGLTRT